MPVPMKRQVSSSIEREGPRGGRQLSGVSESSTDEKPFPLRTLSLDSTSTWSRIFHSGTAGGGKLESSPDVEAGILLRPRLQRFLVMQVLLSNLVRPP